jgi:hypothetical protein
LRLLRESGTRRAGRTLRHEASFDAVHELTAVVSALGERVEQESQLRRDALAMLGQGVARDRDAAGVVADQLETLESRVEDSQREAAGGATRRRAEGGAPRRVTTASIGCDRAPEAIELRLAAERDHGSAASTGSRGRRVAAAALTEAVGELICAHARRTASAASWATRSPSCEQPDARTRRCATC